MRGKGWLFSGPFEQPWAAPLELTANSDPQLQPASDRLDFTWDRVIIAGVGA